MSNHNNQNKNNDFSFLGEEIAGRIKEERSRILEDIQSSELIISEEHKKLEETRQKLQKFDASLAHAIGGVIPVAPPQAAPSPARPRVESMRERPRSLKTAIAQIAGWDVVNIDFLMHHLPQIGWRTESKDPRHIVSHTLAANKDAFERIPGKRGHYRVRPEFLTKLGIRPPKTGVRKTLATTEHGSIEQALEQMKVSSTG